MVDTHAHIALCEGDAAGVVERARDAGLTRILTVGLDEESNSGAVALAREHEEVWAAVGRHPNSATGWDEAAEAELRVLAADEHVVAIGETGLDFYRDRASREDQMAAFRAQIRIAREVAKPLVIHMRSGEVEAAGCGGRVVCASRVRGGRRRCRSPLLLGAARAGGRGDGEQVVLLVRGECHLPQGGRRFVRRRGSCPTI